MYELIAKANLKLIQLKNLFRTSDLSCPECLCFISQDLHVILVLQAMINRFEWFSKLFNTLFIKQPKLSQIGVILEK